MSITIETLGRRHSGTAKFGRAALLLIVCCCAVFPSEVVAQGQADNCLELVRLSRTTSQSISNEADFADHVKDFCAKYKQRTRSGNSADYGLSYKYLGASMESSSRSEENVASTYCRYQGDMRANEASYSTYLDGIAPGAYLAYAACLNAREGGIIYSLSGLERDRLFMSIALQSSNMNEFAELSYHASSGVTCRWGNQDTHNSKNQLRGNETTTLICRRELPHSEPLAEPDQVNIVRANSTRDQPIDIPWQKYNGDDEPVGTLADIRRELSGQLDKLAAQLATFDARLNGTDERLQRLKLVRSTKHDQYLSRDKEIRSRVGTVRERLIPYDEGICLLLGTSGRILQREHARLERGKYAPENKDYWYLELKDGHRDAWVGARVACYQYELTIVDER